MSVWSFILGFVIGGVSGATGFYYYALWWTKHHTQQQKIEAQQRAIEQLHKTIKATEQKASIATAVNPNATITDGYGKPVEKPALPPVEIKYTPSEAQTARVESDLVELEQILLRVRPAVIHRANAKLIKTELPPDATSEQLSEIILSHYRQTASQKFVNVNVKSWQQHLK